MRGDPHMKNTKIIIDRSRKEPTEIRYNFITRGGTILAKNRLEALKGLIELKRRGLITR